MTNFESELKEILNEFEDNIRLGKTERGYWVTWAKEEIIALAKKTALEEQRKGIEEGIKMERASRESDKKEEEATWKEPDLSEF
jgi:hypothetical protein